MQADEAFRAVSTPSAADAAQLTLLPPAYKRQAWLAVGALLTFVVAYIGLAAWFLFTAWRLTFGSGAGNGEGMGFLVAGLAVVLAVFMIKAVFFIQRGEPDGLTELSPAEQPELFAFLHDLADRAGAPRPHKVYASARVNAAVFYDLSLLNLLVPSRKNLEIGLGLVNVLTLGEFKAVLAHEFGHFAQRSMAVGRWVYVAHQIAANMVARRDKLDAFLVGLSRFDVRVAWVGWLLQIVVWSIRSLVATAFQGVLVMQRALSREMEMQADLVAVSLTGSDALVHALLKLQAADDSWDRTLSMAAAEQGKERPARDLFAMQEHLMRRMGQILGDPLYGRVPEMPPDAPQAHRVFKAELAQPPRMWLSHPLNHEREANAKRVYVPAPFDDRPAWTVFTAPHALREKVSAQVRGQHDAEPVSVADSLRAIDEAFDRQSLDGRYHGAYLGRSVVRSCGLLKDLYTAQAVSIRDLERLYPTTLVADIELQRQLERELAQLQALQDGALQASGRQINYRGRALSRKQLPAQIAQVRGELHEVQHKLHEHDRLCRSAHLAAAREAGQGWEAHVQGLLAVLHYADHVEANLLDLQRIVAHTFRVVTATGKVSDAKLDRLISVANELQAAMAKVHAQRGQVKLDAKLLSVLGSDGWAGQLGDLDLPPAQRGNINEWLKVVDSWLNKTAGDCGALRRAALDTLLETEAMLARHVLDDGPLYAAPAASVVPADHDLLVLGQERQPQDKLDWWARFQLADGKPAAILRLSVAAGIVASFVLVGGALGTHHLMVYNGLARPVKVQVGERALSLAPLSSASMDIDSAEHLHVQAHTDDGQLIESFDTERSGRPVYNVAGASPLVEWTAVYGPATPRAERPLGAPRWFGTHADVLFAEPPQTVSTKNGQGATRDVLQGAADWPVSRQMEALAQHPEARDQVISAHARWDGVDSPDLVQWLYLDHRRPNSGRILAARLKESPQDLLLLRTQQDFAREAGEYAQVCADHTRQATARPDDPAWRYLAVRCMPEGPAKSDAFLEGARRWPDHAWFGFAASYVHAEAGRWQAALEGMARARRALPALASAIADDEARLRRLTQGEQADLQDLAAVSPALKLFLHLESGAADGDPQLGPVPKAYAALARADFIKGQAFVGSDADASARWHRLAVASDGVPADVRDVAVKLAPDAGLDEATLWAHVGMAMRLRQDLGALEKKVNGLASAQGRDADGTLRTMWRILMTVHHQGPQAVSDADFAGLQPQQRGFVYSAAVTALGTRAPAAWRQAAKRLLFATERPYFM